MDCRSRAFKAEPFGLEGRVLLASAHALTRGPAYVQFQGAFGSLGTSTTNATTTPNAATPTTAAQTTTTQASTAQLAVAQTTTAAIGSTRPTLVEPANAQSAPTQVVGQQAGVATVVLMRSDNIGRMQVQVRTDPSSPAVGVNVGALDQTVTFAKGQMDAGVTVPILAGAPNPGEVDVNLTVSSVAGSRPIVAGGSLELKIVSSDATVPPQIVSTEGKRHSIVLTFSKPMNAVEASNVNNYAVRWSTEHFKYDDIGALALFVSPWGSGTSSSSGYVRLKSAHYDPATNSVTLIPRRALTYSGATGLTVTQAQPVKAAGVNGQGSNVGPGLTDVEGNPIGGATTPGKFSAYVFRGFNYPA